MYVLLYFDFVLLSMHNALSFQLKIVGRDTVDGQRSACYLAVGLWRVV